MSERDVLTRSADDATCDRAAALLGDRRRLLRGIQIRADAGRDGDDANRREGGGQRCGGAIAAGAAAKDRVHGVSRRLGDPIRRRPRPDRASRKQYPGAYVSETTLSGMKGYR